MSQRQDSRVFGKKPKEHTIIIASGDRIRHVTIRPWMTGLVVSFLGVIAISYLAATSYLVLRDDLIGAAMARQARMQHVYEDRIAALRAQVDRVTSRQLLDQQLMETKVSELIERQNALSTRHGRLGPLLDRMGINPLAAPVPITKPQRRAGLTPATLPDPAFASASAAAPASAHGGFTGAAETVGDRADRIFSTVTLSLKSIERDQITKIQGLAADAFQTADQINSLIVETGLPAIRLDDSAVGGPFVRPNEPNAFELSLDDLDAALNRLDTVRKQAEKMPVSIPAPGADITSTFGTRKDPFLGRLALHSGIDFRTPTGTPIYSSGAGTVVSAGRSGGYGNLVEIDHGHGFTTRYAHLSEILVSKGDTVIAGQPIGKAGSTGRSTGPHLHYEVRHNGDAIDPMRFIKAARMLKPLLDPS